MSARLRYQASIICALLVASRVSAQLPEEIVEVVGQTPLGAGIDIDRIASNVQQATGESVRKSHSIGLSDYLQRNLGSVMINEAQSNPLQPDLQYRGFVGSPLLGLPQGIAVYQDGVRLNEPFGDTVNWALLPESAIDQIYLMPGSNPLFGLNALGGAISIHTRDGFTSPGTAAEFYGGSFGRIGIELTTGNAIDDFGYFLTAEHVEEDGWRDFSPTEATQLFGKIGWRHARTSIDLSLGVAETDLIGNGPLPVELLALNREAIFTRPDITRNELGLISLGVDRDLSEALVVTGNAYLRSSDITSTNGDDSEFEACAADPGFFCRDDDGDESLVLDIEGNAVAYSEALEGAAVNRTATDQDGAGFGIQADWTARLGEHDNRLVVGLVYDQSSIGFEAGTELGSLDESRMAVPGGVFVGESATGLEAETASVGIYLANTFALAEHVALTVAGRYNDTGVTLIDRLGTALNGDHDFHRLNPAVSLTAELTDEITLYAGFSESARTPSPVELTCADEDDPCRLPNAFLADPPLKQVVATTLEAGLRGRSPIDWHAGLFRTTNHDDILFVSAGALTNQGFFANVGRTRRDGVEINLAGGDAETGQWFSNYTFLEATFRQNLILPSAHSPAAQGGEIAVRPGNRLPLVPQHLLKLGFTRPLASRVSLGMTLRAGSGFHMRGDEANALDEFGDYVVIDLRGEIGVSERVELFFSIDNLFDREFETFGLFGEPGEVLGDAFEDPRFVSPGAPRAGWLGVRVAL